MKLFDSTRIPTLTRALDAYALRHKVIAENIANVETPGYRTKTVSFEKELTDAMNGRALVGTRTDPRHLSLGAEAPGESVAHVEDVPRASGQDGAISGVNQVDIDAEMTELATNQIRFRFAARLLGETFRGIQKSIRGQV
jgi:flagellar basal-body rod protein FlgB